MLAVGNKTQHRGGSVFFKIDPEYKTELIYVALLFPFVSLLACCPPLVLHKL